MKKFTVMFSDGEVRQWDGPYLTSDKYRSICRTLIWNFIHYCSEIEEAVIYVDDELLDTWAVDRSIFRDQNKGYLYVGGDIIREVHAPWTYLTK